MNLRVTMRTSRPPDRIFDMILDLDTDTSESCMTVESDARVEMCRLGMSEAGAEKFYLLAWERL